MYKFRKFLAVVACVVLMLTLPGCEEVIPLTKDEEKIISEYAAHMISKYNMLQNEGYMFVMPLRAQEIMDEIRPPEPVEEENTEENPEENSDDNSDNSGNNSSDSGKTEDPVDNTVYVSLSESLGLDKIGIEAVYTGTDFTDTIETMPLPDGKLWAVMHVALVNKTSEDKYFDMLEISPDIAATFNNSDTTVRPEFTILDGDLSTFMGTVPAGDMVDTYFLFKVPYEKKPKVNSLKLKVTHDDESYDVMLVK